MRFLKAVTIPVRSLAAGWLGDGRQAERTQREWWSYLGSFGDDFFSDD